MNTPDSRPGVAETMDAAIEQVIAASHQYSDPVDQAEALEQALGAIPKIQMRLGQARSESIRKALEMRSAVDVAQRLGVTRQRIYQLARAGDASL